MNIRLSAAELEFSLFDLQGRELSPQVKRTGADTWELELAGLRPGIYLLHFSNSEGNGTARLRVE